jgi:hypothetical protein
MTGFRAAVQHLGLFIPWHAFLCESSGEINRIWETQKTCLSKRMTWLADNIQLLRRSAEDVARDARQWAALSGEGDPTADAVGSGSTEGHDAQGVEHRPGGVGLATRLIDVLRNAMTRKEITAGSKEISSMVEQMYRFQATALDSTDDLRATVIPDHDAHILGGSISRAEIPRQEQLRSIKSQQNGLSREREKMIQGLQNQLGGTAAADGVAAHSGSDRPGQQDDPTTHADQRGPSRDTGPSTGVMFGPSTSFCETGRQVAESFTLNQRQSIALQLIPCSTHLSAAPTYRQAKKKFPHTNCYFPTPSQRVTKDRNNKLIAIFQFGIECILIFSWPLNCAPSARACHR